MQYKILGTIIAAPLALLIWFAASIVVSVTWRFFSQYTAPFSIEIANYVASALGAMGGVVAAQSVCDRILKDYSHKAVFICFVLAIAAGVKEVVDGANFHRLSSVDLQVIIDMTVTGITAFAVFWDVKKSPFQA